MKRILILFIITAFLSGCAKIAHMQELLRIKGLSDNQETQHGYVEKTDKNFDKLLAAIKENRMDEYTRKRSILKAFGEPIFSKDVEKNGQIFNQWLYRYAMKYFDSEKVYLYFDDAGKLVDWEHMVAPVKKGEQ